VVGAILRRLVVGSVLRNGGAVERCRRRRRRRYKHRVCKCDHRSNGWQADCAGVERQTM